MTIRETTFRETSFREKTTRESNHPGNDCKPGAYSNPPDPLTVFEGLILRERRGSGSEGIGVREEEDRGGEGRLPSAPGSGGGREEKRARKVA